MKAVTCKTQWHLVVAWLWQTKQWTPTHDIQSRQTDFGFIGSSGEQRVRELARNDACIPEELRNKVEKKREGKYEFFRYKKAASRTDYAARTMPHTQRRCVAASMRGCRLVKFSMYDQLRTGCAYDRADLLAIKPRCWDPGLRASVHQRFIS